MERLRCNNITTVVRCWCIKVAWRAHPTILVRVFGTYYVWETIYKIFGHGYKRPTPTAPPSAEPIHASFVGPILMAPECRGGPSNCFVSLVDRLALQLLQGRHFEPQTVDEAHAIVPDAKYDGAARHVLHRQRPRRRPRNGLRHRWSSRTPSVECALRTAGVREPATMTETLLSAELTTVSDVAELGAGEILELFAGLRSASVPLGDRSRLRKAARGVGCS
jgi:hypothetical protein